MIETRPPANLLSVFRRLVPPRFARFPVPFLLVWVTALTLTACAGTGAGRRSPHDDALQLSPAELQVKVRALADPFSGIVEETVAELWQTADTADERRNLLIWQVNVVNALQRATLQPVPLAALFDTWALVEQLRGFAETAAESFLDAEQASILLRAVTRMERSLMAIAVEAGGREGAATAAGLVREWAAEHPIDRFVSRTSTESELAHWTARGNMSAMAAVKSLGASLDDVMARLDLYSEYLPKQAAWHAQALAYDLLEPGQAEGPLADLSKTATAFDRIAASLEGYPGVVADERRVVLDAVTREREQVLAELLDKITELELFIQDERIDFVENQLRIERQAIFEAIAAERAIIIAEAKQERAATMDELETMVGELIEHSAVKIVDHFFLRAVQLLAIGLIGIGLIAGVAVVLWKRS